MSITRSKTCRNAHANIGIADLTALKTIGTFEIRNQLKSAVKLIDKKELIKAVKYLHENKRYISIWNLRKIVDEPSANVLEALSDNGIDFELKGKVCIIRLYDPKSEKLEVIAEISKE